MKQFAGSVDHVVPRDEAVFSFGPEMSPVLEVDPGTIVTFEAQDCFSGQIRTEGAIDFSAPCGCKPRTCLVIPSGRSSMTRRFRVQTIMRSAWEHFFWRHRLRMY